jgi:hypothetical protein
LFLVASSTGCGGGDRLDSPEDHERERGPNAAAPSKDRAALAALIAAPRSCATATDCPAGSHCDGARCAWACYASSDCGAAGVCSADGRCLHDRAALDLPRAAPTGPIVAFDATQPRACVFTEDCPGGAYCDIGRQQCAQDCSASAACAAGKSCDANGRCASAGGPPAYLPRLDVSPSAIELLRPADAGSLVEHTRRVTVSLFTASLPSVAAARPTVRLRAAAGAEIQCASTGLDIPLSGFTDECTLDTWSFAPYDAGHRAARNVWVRLKSATVPGDVSWSIAVSGADVVATARSIAIALPERLRGAAATPREGEYRGDIAVQGSAVSGTVDRSALGERRIPVSATVTADGIVLVDESRQIAPSGTLYYSLTRANSYDEDWIVARPSETFERDKVANGGAIAARIVQDTFVPEWKDGLLTGSIRMTIPSLGNASSTYAFALRRVGDESHAACVTGACPAGTACDARIRRCLAGTEWHPASTVDNTLVHKRLETWSTASRAILASAAGALTMASVPGDEYRTAFPGGGAIAGAQVARLGAPSTSALASLGYGICRRDFGGFLRRMNPSGGAAMSNGASLVYSKLVKRTRPMIDDGLACYARDLPTLDATTSESFCDTMYDNLTYAVGTGYTKGGAFATCTTAAPTPEQAAETKRTFVPCMQGERHAPILPGAPLPWFWEYNVSCEAVSDRGTVAAWTAQGATPAEIQRRTAAGELRAAYDAFVKAQCRPTEKSLHLTYREGSSLWGPGSEQHPLHDEELEIALCPLPYDAIFDARGPRAIERMACYEANAGDPSRILDSAVFGPRHHETYRHLACEDGRVPGVFPLLTYKDRGAHTTSSDMLRSCLDDLQRDVPAAGDPAAQARAAFGASPCVQFARFASTLDQAKVFGPRHYMNLLREWLTVQSFVADQGRMQWENASVLAGASSPTQGGPDPSEGDPRVLRELMTQLDRGWELVLSRDVSAALLDVAADAQANPDYRIGYTSSSNPAHEQGIGLPVAMLEATSKYLLVLEKLVDRSAGDAFAWCQAGATPTDRDVVRDRIGSTFRYATAVEAFAHALLAHASPRPIAWSPQWDGAKNEYAAVRARVHKKATDLLRCNNPLGISDGEVPLYFGRNVGTDAPDRFFASSDYLFGLAMDEILPAGASLSTARAAWIQARQSEVQQIATDLDRDRRLEDLRTRYGTPIVEACGLPFAAKDVLGAFDRSKPNALAVETCHVDLGRPGCANASDTACLRGTIGEASLAIRAATQDVALARKNWEDSQKAYDTQFAFCTTQARDNAARERAMRAHQTTMTKLRAAKAAADTVAILAEALNGCSSWLDDVMSFGASCATSLVEGFAKTTSVTIAAVMDQAQQAHQLEIEELRDDAGVHACLNEADLRRIGITSAAMQIERRAVDLEAAYLRVRNTQDRVRQLLVEGAASVARETSRVLPSVAHHYWFEESVARYHGELDRSKKLTYLALQAFEYDYQQSLALRSDVIRARHPDELKKVLDEVNRFRGTRKINGNGPAALNVVLSVRDDLLGLRVDPLTQLEIPPEERNLRLQTRLRAPEAALFDKGGRYIGQAVTFSLRDVGETANQCAERLWNVAATIVGGTAGSAPRGQIYLLKRNIADSRWCRGHGGDAPVQFGKIRTSGVLFGIDPSGISSSDDASTFVMATLQPWFNMPRDQFYRAEGLTGGSDQLKGRGMYGEYVLVFPYDGLLHDTGFSLDQLEDVLLRFDYHAVANANL